jgi:hypothetical protein
MMKNQRIKYRIEKDMNVLREKVRMKEEITTPEKLLSPKGAKVFSEHNREHSKNRFFPRIRITKINPHAYLWVLCD